MPYQVVMQLDQVILNQELYDLYVLAVAGQRRQVDVPQLEDLEDCDQEPERDVLLRVIGKVCGQEIHTLDVPNLWVIVPERQ